MTREEAKEVFINRGYVKVKGGIIFDGDKWRQSVVVITEWLKQQPCEDAISGQAVKEQMIKYGFHAPDMTVTEFVEELLPVSVAEKVGYWIDDTDGYGTSCSKCGKWYPHSYLTKQDVIYCCRCGVKMIDPQESEDKE